MAKRARRKHVRGREVPAEAVIPAPVAQGRLSWSGHDWLWGSILILAVILTYQPVWYAGFIWDDDAHVTANPCILGPLGLKEIWTTQAAQICPLVLTTFWVEHALWGLAPLPYHLVNVLLHGACTILLWRVLLSLRVPGAWLGAALWALHPVQVETVAWISEMKNTQSCLFYLLSILFFARWIRGRDLDGGTGRGWTYALSFVCAALAMASKSSTVILPLVLCLCAWWMEGRWKWRNLARVAPLIPLSLATVALSIWTQGLHPAATVNPQAVPGWPERLAMAGDAVWFYLGKLLWPHPLITIYPLPQIDARTWLSSLPLLAVGIVGLVLWLNRESRLRPCFFAFTYFLVALLPELELADSYIADHYQYLASMGPLVLVGAGMTRLSDFVSSGLRWLRSAAMAGLLLLFGVLSWWQTWFYESQETLWSHTLAENQNSWVGYNNLGLALFMKGKVEEAISQYRKALQINPNDANTHNNFGVALYRKNK